MDRERGDHESADQTEARLEQNLATAVEAMDAKDQRELDGLADEIRRTVLVVVGEQTVNVVMDTRGDWRAVIPEWQKMAPFPTELEAVTYAEEWLLRRL